MQGGQMQMTPEMLQQMVMQQGGSPQGEIPAYLMEQIARESGDTGLPSVPPEVSGGGM